MTTRTSAVPSASRSLTCPTRTSGHVHAATRYVTIVHSVKYARVSEAHASQICQFCFNNIKTTMNGLCPACRRPYDESTIEFKNITPEE